jgi:chorismate dehydratase
MIRLGHIVYSNCFPVHALLVDREPPDDIAMVPGVPAELNAQLAEGRIDVAPCSSIEYARHRDQYRILPGLAIASAGPVHSILLESTVAAEDLGGRAVAVPTASATSIVLLRILLETRMKVRPALRWFDQGGAADPIEEGAAAALWIGDVALRRARRPGRRFLDLGELWTHWTGLPFVYAVWQARAGVEPADLERVHQLLTESRAYFDANLEDLARRHAGRFGIEAHRLAPYWRSLRYGLDADTQRGLLHFYRLAAELGDAAPVEALEWADLPAARGRARLFG